MGAPELTDLVLAGVALAAAAQDLTTGRIQNHLTVPALPAALLLSWLEAGHLGLGRALLATLGVGLPFLALHRARMVGGGDVKLACALAAFRGLVFAYSFLFYGCLLAALAGGARRIARRGQVPAPLPLGAFLAMGALWVLAEERLGAALVDLVWPAGGAWHS